MLHKYYSKLPYEISKYCTKLPCEISFPLLFFIFIISPSILHIYIYNLTLVSFNLNSYIIILCNNLFYFLVQYLSYHSILFEFNLIELKNKQIYIVLLPILNIREKLLFKFIKKLIYHQYYLIRYLDFQ
jgi:hypothetical protein